MSDVFCSMFDWFIRLSVSFVISKGDYFEYGVTTLSLKPFLHCFFCDCLSGAIQVDLGRVRSLSGVASQGYMPSMFVSSYRVNYSTDGYTWHSYKNRGDSRSKVRETKFSVVHTTPEEFENRGFTLKTRQMFSIHITSEEFQNATMSGHFGFVFEENSGREITRLS